jgi:DNA polymerase-4
VTTHEALHPWLTQRKIIHFDMDAFYAAVEVRHRPELRGKPLVIGGSPQSRGVVCTASYEARTFGVKSAMPCSHAARLCPQAIFLKPNFELYKSASQAIHSIFARYTDRIEPLSLDEAYLDVTDHEKGLFATTIARRIQEEILQELQLTGSAGVAPNKLVAKIASDMHKPYGLTIVLPQQVSRFIAPLPLRRIHGIGPASEKRLQGLGLHRCSDVWSWSRERLESELGQMGSWLWARSRGLDDRPVEVQRERKSLGREETFAEDILDKDRLREELHTLCLEVATALRKKGLGGRTITLKVKYADFTRASRSYSWEQATDDAAQIEGAGRNLLESTEAGRRRIRLLGISLSNLVEAGPSGLGSEFQLGLQL